jgi:hypothetical protein
MKKNVIYSFFLVIVSVNAQLKARRISTYYGKQISQYQGSLFQLLMESNIKKQKYGVTNEGRDLNVYFISTPENLANLDLIRNNNLAIICLIKKQKRLVTSLLCG